MKHEDDDDDEDHDDTDAYEIKKVKLLRLRNPWGNLLIKTLFIF